ncbi:hypothetical protein LXL04_019135 [Taraxacum kok-saghyz]
MEYQDKPGCNVFFICFSFFESSLMEEVGEEVESFGSGEKDFSGEKIQLTNKGYISQFLKNNKMIKGSVNWGCLLEKRNTILLACIQSIILLPKNSKKNEIGAYPESAFLLLSRIVTLLLSRITVPLSNRRVNQNQRDSSIIAVNNKALTRLLEEEAAEFVHKSDLEDKLNQFMLIYMRLKSNMQLNLNQKKEKQHCLLHFKKMMMILSIRLNEKKLFIFMGIQFCSFDSIISVLINGFQIWQLSFNMVSFDSWVSIMAVIIQYNPKKIQNYKMASIKNIVFMIAPEF